MNKAVCLHTRPMYQGHVINLNVDHVRLPNGHTTALDIVHHPGAAAVVAVDHDQHVFLVRQYRYAAHQSWLLEIPAGKLDADESPQQCAQRELEEEAGVQAQKLIPMGFVWTSPGFADEQIWLFLATDLICTAQRLESDEILSVVRMPFQDAIKQAYQGEMTDGKSICGLLRAAHLMG